MEGFSDYETEMKYRQFSPSLETLELEFETLSENELCMIDEVVTYLKYVLGSI